VGRSQERVIRKRIRHKAEDQVGAHLGPHIGRPRKVQELLLATSINEQKWRPKASQNRCIPLIIHIYVVVFNIRPVLVAHPLTTARTPPN